MPRRNWAEVFLPEFGWLIVDILLYPNNDEDFISLTDIARHKDALHTDSIIQNWMRNRNTIELLGFWETIYNTDFKPLEFEGFRKQAGLNSFVMTPKRIVSRNLSNGEKYARDFGNLQIVFTDMKDHI